MTPYPTEDPVLTRFHAALEIVYGERIARVVLFGSRARGDAWLDSNYDIGLFLDEMESFGPESEVFAEIETDLLIVINAVVNTLALVEDAYANRTGFMR